MPEFDGRATLTAIDPGKLISQISLLSSGYRKLDCLFHANISRWQSVLITPEAAVSLMNFPDLTEAFTDAAHIATARASRISKIFTSTTGYFPVHHCTDFPQVRIPNCAILSPTCKTSFLAIRPVELGLSAIKRATLIPASVHRQWTTSRFVVRRVVVSRIAYG